MNQSAEKELSAVGHCTVGPATSTHQCTYSAQTARCFTCSAPRPEASTCSCEPGRCNPLTCNHCAMADTPELCPKWLELS